MNEYYSLLEIGKLNLKYPVTVNGLDGECFTYSIYFENADITSKYAQIDEAVEKFAEENGEDDYPGYLDVSNGGNKVVIYQDLGNTDGSNRPIHGLLKVIDSVSGVKKVIINEDITPMSEDDMMQKMLEIMRMNGYQG